MIALYLSAKRGVIAAGYEKEIAWQEQACFEPLTERRFLSEAAWVVLSSGMREFVVRRVFPGVAAAFAHFATGEATARSAARGGRQRALRVFSHSGKIDAIIQIARHVVATGLDEVRRRLNQNGAAYLRTLPYLGPITSVHLAKNLGYDVVKPDRHLVRIALACGYGQPEEMCKRLHDLLGEPVAVVDIVLWRYATLRRDYLAALNTAARMGMATRPSMGARRGRQVGRAVPDPPGLLSL